MCQNMCLKTPPLGVNREGEFFVSLVRLLRCESNLVSMFREPLALMQTPPRRDDKPTIRFRLSIGMSTGQITIKRAEHQRLITFTVRTAKLFLFLWHR